MSVQVVYRKGRFYYLADRPVVLPKPRRDRMSVASLLI